MNNINDVEYLEKQIKYYADKYYQGEPEITDELFDSLVDELRKIKPDSQILTTGWGFEVQGNKIKHKYTHIGSLDKCKTYKEIPDMFKVNQMIYVSPKLDGLSAVAYYKNGKLIKGITRGNGEYGKDITNKLIKILGNEIQDKSFTGGVRGELIISNSNWELLKQKYNDSDMIAPRNFAAGIINRDEIEEDIQYIDMVVYKVVGDESNKLRNRHQVLEWLSQNFKYHIPELCIYITQDWDSNTAVNIFNLFKQNGYNLDGLVLTLDNIQYTNNNGILYTEVAYKFAAPSIETTVIDIEWSLSRTQRYVPVIRIKPVELSGANIERATGNNAKMIKSLGIGPGAEISIQRSGEVIPKILEVISPVQVDLPNNCPYCNDKLQWDGVDLVCKNPNCPNIESSDLQQWCEVIGETDGLQWTLMKQYLDKYNVHNIKSLYDNKKYIWEDLNCRQLSLTELKIREFFDKLYIQNVDIDKALLALNIPRLGDKTVKLLCKNKTLILSLLAYFYQQEVDINTIKDFLISVVKEATTKSILENKNKYLNLLYLFSSDLQTNRINFYNLDNINKEIKYVAVTGSLQSMKRKDFEKLINQYGYELTSSLSKCEYLITNNPNSNSTKNKEAQKFNIPIISEADFLQKLQ